LRLELPAIGQHSVGRSVDINSQTLVNMYAQVNVDGAKGPATLHCTPALALIGSIGNGPCRSTGIRWKDNAYFVSGAHLVGIDVSQVVTSKGTIATTTGFVSMAASQVEVMFVDGQDGWLWDGTTLTQIVDAGFVTLVPTHVTYIDGYFVVNDAFTGNFYISSLNDGSTWDLLDVANAEANPDDITVLISTNRELWLFGNQLAELWYNSGNADFPFEPYRSGVSEWGIHAPASLAKADEALFWLSSNREGANMVLSARGQSPLVISNRDIEWEIAQLGTTTDAIGWTYQYGGHTFYVLSFPTGDKTFVYDVSTQFWHRRKSWGIGRHRMYGTVFNRVHMAGDAFNGNFYRLDHAFFADNGEIIERVRTTQVTHKNRQRLRIDCLDLDIQTGVGTATGQGSDPQIVLHYSKDGGHSWSKGTWRSMGKLGEHGRRVRWFGLGIAYQWVFRFTVTDPVDVTMVALFADVTVCQS
jgi:hypothetical protein